MRWRFVDDDLWKLRFGRVSYDTWYWQNSGNNTAGPIIPEIRIHCFIRYLADGSYLGICNLVSIPHSTFYYILWKTCDAINDCPELAFRIPTTEAELSAASAYFENIICQGIMRGCIGVINGWICCIDELPSSLVGNVQSCFSGHYQWHGFNVQAIVDCLGRFLFIAVAAPGSQPDINTFSWTSLHEVLSDLPVDYFIIGDNAYKPT